MEKFEAKTPLTYGLKKNDILYFFHIPKTAGTSLIHTLENYFDFNTLLPSYVWDQLLLNMPKNFSKYRFVKGHFGYGIYKILMKKPVYITMLRKPDDVIVSHYKMIQRLPEHAKRYHISKEETLSDLLLRPVIHGQENTQCRCLVCDLDVLAKTKGWNKKALEEFIFEDQPEFNLPNISDEEILEIAKNRLLEFKFFGIVERYEESLFLLHYTFGWRPIRDTTKLNVATDNRTDISKEARKNLEERTKIDVKLYQFAQQLFESRYSQMIQDLREKYYEAKYENMTVNDVVYDMLEKHYDDHYHEWHTEVSSIDYNFGMTLDGAGWHHREIFSDKTIFRWTGPDTKSVIDFPLKQNRDLRIQFRVPDSMSPDILNSLQLKVNDTPIEIKKSKRIIHKSKAPFEGTIPASTLKSKNNFTRLTFEINHTIAPKSIDPESKDDRKLGLAFDWIKIFPVKKS